MPAGCDADQALSAAAPLAARRRTLVFLAVCALGVSSIMTQLTLMRELLGVLAGNEMIFGIILGNWLLLTGLGTQLGRALRRLGRPISVLIAAQVLIALLPPVSVFAVRALRNVVFLRGEMIGVAGAVVGCLVVLLPYCLLAGCVLTLACAVLGRGDDPAAIGRVYFLDSIGDIAGGLVFTFVLRLQTRYIAFGGLLVGLFDHFGILYFPALVNLALAGTLAVVFRRRALLAVTAAAGAAGAAVILTFDLDAVSMSILHSGERIVFQGNSPYGSLVVTESAGQHNFIQNGITLFSTRDVERVEQTVHYAMAQRPAARDVLLISGGVSGTAREVLKYGPARVDYVELDPLIVEVARRYLPESLDDERIGVFYTDGRRFVRHAPRRYDVIIADVPDPATFQINRFYTEQFFRQARAALKDGGVLSISLGQYENYVSPELARLIAAANRTLKRVFRNVLILPAGKVRFLASDGPLTAEGLAERIERRGVRTVLVNRPHLRATLTPERLADMRRAAAGDAPVNTDFGPVLCYYHLLHWISRFKVRLGLLEAALLAALAAYLVRIRPVSLTVFTTGFAAASLEVVLLAGFQILYGSVYHQLALIVTMFMLGLAVGSVIMNRMLARRRRRDLVVLEFAVAAFALAVPPALMGLGYVGGGAARVAVPAMTLLLAVLVGMEFPLAGKLEFSGAAAPVAARLYTADFVGACLGALLVSTLLIPLLGIVAVCLIAAALNVVSGAILWRT